MGAIARLTTVVSVERKMNERGWGVDFLNSLHSLASLCVEHRSGEGTRLALKKEDPVIPSPEAKALMSVTTLPQNKHQTCTLHVAF